MNVIDSPAAHAHWLPSHVQITIHQAKDLHLKNKSGHSELYVRLQVNKDHYTTESLLKQPHPHWNQIFTIPLMSLTSVFHVTVRQKGRFGDSYLGYIAINPGSFKIGPCPTTHWYKLGCKPGKTSTKLRGDLQVTFQFLSNWSGQAKRGRVMLQRSSSDLKLGGTALGHADSDEILTGGRLNQPKAKKEILGALRRSFRRKNRSPVFKNCDEDFASFSSQSASSTPQIIRKRANSVTMADAGSNSLSSTSYLSNGTSDSDTVNSVPHTPPPGKSCRISEGEEAPVLNKAGPASPEHEDTKLTSESKFRKFKSKKRPWGLQALPSPASTPNSSETPPGGQNHVFPEELEEEEEEVADDACKTSQPEEATFRYKSRVNVLSRSFRGHDSAAARFAARQRNEQETNSSSAEATLR